MMRGMDNENRLPIPAIETATEPIRSAADLQQRWLALMAPLGFGERLLWFGFIGPDHRFIKILNHMPIGPRPQSRSIKNLMSALRTLLTDTLPPQTTVALLLTGPGHGGISAADRVWSKQLSEMATRFGIPLEPIFRANDALLQEVTFPEAS